MKRPAGITALTIFFAFGAAASFVSCISLLVPHSFLEPMWQLNPRAHVALGSIGMWAIILLAPVSIACALAAYGLWRGTRWGYWIAIAVLTINLLGDAVNAISGIEPRAAIGVPIAAAILLYLASQRIRTFFYPPGFSATL